MANPQVVTMPEWAWQKVATDVTLGVIHRLDVIVDYYQTFRLTGGTAPAVPEEGTLPAEAVKMFVVSSEEVIDSLEAIDVYVMCVNIDTENEYTGTIRVDI